MNKRGFNEKHGHKGHNVLNHYAALKGNMSVDKLGTCRARSMLSLKGKKASELSATPFSCAIHASRSAYRVHNEYNMSSHELKKCL